MNNSRQKKKRLPPWFKISLKGKKGRSLVRKTLREFGLHSVCEGASCPNLCDCWSRRTATFMILGENCSRNCRFCAVAHAAPEPLDPQEPENIALAARKLALRHVVVTSVTRDDLPDGGAQQFVATLAAVREQLPTATLEVLVPDFGGEPSLIRRVVAAAPDVFNHNIETCRRLTPRLRDRADYDRSLSVLRLAAEQGADGMIVKSGFMLGAGENDSEIREMLTDLRSADVSSVTIGQYLAPSDEHWPVDRFVPPEVFAGWRTFCLQDLGFDYAACGPHVRSSYHAERHL